jgi:hypothetical protein
VNKQELLKCLDHRVEKERKWAERLKDNHDEHISHSSAGWAFRVARLLVEELDD